MSSPPTVDLTAETSPILTRLSKGQVAKLARAIPVEVARTAEDFGEWTKCFDPPKSSVDCSLNLVLDKRVYQLSSGTRVQILDVRENPLHPSAMPGQLVQARVLDGPNRDEMVWTLDEWLTIEPTDETAIADLRRRQEIFALASDGIAAAMATADRQYPEPPPGTPVTPAYLKRADQHDTLFTNLYEASNRKVALKYGLSDRDVIRITMEGNRAGWPRK